MFRAALAALIALLVLAVVRTVVWPVTYEGDETPAAFPQTDSGETYSILEPDGYDDGDDVPLVMFFHGTGRNHDVLGNANTDAFVRAIPDATGSLVVTPFAHGDNWGNNEGLEAYRDVLDEIEADYDITTTTFVAASMGSISALLLSDEADAYYGIYPVTNLAAQYDTDHARLIEAAYDFDDPDEYVTATRGHDPMKHTGWPDIPYRFVQSPNDTLVASDTNSLALAKKLRKQGLTATTLAGTGNHGDPSLTNIDDLTRFLADLD